jgi:hypothetical protein
MGSPYVLIKAMRARGGATQKPSDDRFGGELTSHCYSGGGASAPIPAIRMPIGERVKSTLCRHYPLPCSPSNG